MSDCRRKSTIVDTIQLSAVKKFYYNGYNINYSGGESYG